MAVSPLSGSSFGAVVAGIRGQFQATVLRTAFDGVGPLDPHLDQSIRALDGASADLTRAGVEAIKSDTIGALLDVLA